MQMTFLGFLIKNLLRRRARTLLTIIGVAVAISTVLTLRGVSHGFEQSFVQNFERRGADLVVTAAGVPDQLRSDLDQRIGPKIEAMPGVLRATPGLLELVDLQRGESTISAVVNGWEPGCPLFDDLTIISGRTLEKGDHRKILLGTTLAQNLGKKVADTVEMQREIFTVVGIYQSFTVFENGGAVIPLEELQNLMLRKGSVTGFTVAVESGPGKEQRLAGIKSAIETLTDDQGRTYRISALPTRQYVSNSLPIRMAHGMAWITSLIALIIGGISMMNTMIMSVLERTKEIGILRAVGWRTRRVIFMVLGEAILLSLIASVVGVVVAYSVIQILARLPETSGFVSGEMALVVLGEGLVMTLLIALVGGIYPAYRASKLMPTEALRQE